MSRVIVWLAFEKPPSDGACQWPDNAKSICCGCGFVPVQPRAYGTFLPTCEAWRVPHTVKPLRRMRFNTINARNAPLSATVDGSGTGEIEESKDPNETGVIGPKSIGVVSVGKLGGPVKRLESLFSGMI